MRAGRRKIPGRIRAVVYALAVHFAIVGAMLAGVRWSHDAPMLSIGPIKAQTVEDPELKRRAAEQQRLQEEAERKRKEELRRAEAERKRLEEEQRRVQAEQKRQAELKRRADEERRRQAEIERKRTETEKRRANEERRKDVAARRLQAEESLKEQLEQEEAARDAAARAAREATEVEKYKALIRQRAVRYWSYPPSALRGLKCIVRVRLVPGGEVVQATVIRGSGDAAFDRSVEAAVRKAAPLPVPSDPDLFENFREFTFEFGLEPGTTQ